MSRSIKRTKGLGYDYWGRRALSGNCGYGKWIRKNTVRRERDDARDRLRLGETVDRQWDK